MSGVSRGPDVQQHSLEGNRYTLEGRVPEDPDFREGHFPFQPVLPAYRQLEWVARFAEDAFELEAAPCEIEAMTFRSMLTPGDSFQLELTWEPDERTLSFRYRADEEISAGRLVLPEP